jgi:hypothetical protein
MREKFARRRVSMRPYGQPEEVAHATLSLALPAFLISMESFCRSMVG